MCNAHTRTLANTRTQKKQTAECMCGNVRGRQRGKAGGRVFHCFVMPFSLALSFCFFLFALRPLCYFCSHLLIFQGTRAQKNATRNATVFLHFSCCKIWCNSSKCLYASHIWLPQQCNLLSSRSLSLFQFLALSLSLYLLILYIYYAMIISFYRDFSAKLQEYFS